MSEQSDRQERTRALAGRIQEEIRRAGGAITFARFMELALYEPGLGYYTNPAVTIGQAGDFYTASSVHPVFGETVATAIERLWDSLERPSPFWIVEFGAGEGYLAGDILGFIRERMEWFWPQVRYAIVEKSGFLRVRQQTRLGSLAERVAWCDSPASLQPGGVAGCVLANELLDAFPVHRVRATKSGLKEIYVTGGNADAPASGGSHSSSTSTASTASTADGAAFAEVAGPPSTPKLAAYFADQGVGLAPGWEAEVNLQALEWLGEAAAGLSRGFITIIDYGDEAGALYNEGHPRGTLLCYQAHAVSEEPYRDVGLQDITAHVNFTALLREAARLGLSVHTFTAQGRFLIDHGILERVPKARLENGKLIQEPSAQRLSRAIQTLVLPEAMGRSFRVLVLAKTVKPAGQNQ